MKHDQIRLDTKRVQLLNSLFNILKIGWVKARIIPVFKRVPLERVHFRFILVPPVCFRKDTHPHFIEITTGQGVQRDFRKAIALVNPRLHSGPYPYPWRPMPVAEPACASHIDRTMVMAAGSNTASVTCAAIQFFYITRGPVPPYPFLIGREPKHVTPAAIVKP